MKQTKCLKIGRVIFKAVLFLLLLAGLLFGAQKILKLNMGHRGSDSVRGFYQEERNSIDVLFVGASTMFCTVDPLVLYEDYGIAAYDFGSSAQPFALSYLFMQEALKTQKPKVIALEALCISKELVPDNLNYGITDLPFSATKAKGLLEMFPNDRGEALSYLIPLMQYKDRWQELGRDDFLENYESYDNYAKGAYTPDLVSENPLDFSSYYDEEAFEIPEENIRVFEKMVALCKENDISLLLFKSPNVGWNIGQTKAVSELAKNYEVPFIDYYSLMDELKVDTATDFRDNTHFNRYGSKKASDYMGAYLKEHYDLQDWRETDGENGWDIALRERAHDRQNEILSRTDALPEYMNLLPYDGHTIVFSVTGDTQPMREFLDALAQAFGLDAEALAEGGSFAVRNGECISGLIGQQDGAWSWTEANDHIRLTGYSITWNREVFQLVDDGLTILVYDNEWEQLADIAGFDAYDPAHAVRQTQ